MNEEQRAQLYRTQQQAREDHKLAEERRLAGDPTAARELLEATSPMKRWNGWDPIRKVRQDGEA